MRLSFALCALVAVTALWATSAFADADTDFARFKALQGRWSIEAGGRALSTVMTYDVGSKGSIVTEQFGKELSVIHRDGPALVMIHFCDGGNQPRLRLQPQVEPGVYRFEMYDITDLARPEDPHVQRIIYRMIAPDRMTLDIVWRRGGADEVEAYSLKRQ